VDETNRCKQRLRARDVVLSFREIRHEPFAVARRDGPVDRLRRAEEDSVCERLAIDRVGDRTPQLLPLKPWTIFRGGGTGREVEPQAVWTDADAGLDELHGAVGL